MCHPLGSLDSARPGPLHSYGICCWSQHSKGSQVQGGLHQCGAWSHQVAFTSVWSLSPSSATPVPCAFLLGSAGLSKHHWHSRHQGGDDSRSGSGMGWLMECGVESKAEVRKVRLGRHGGQGLLTGVAGELTVRKEARCAMGD